MALPLVDLTSNPAPGVSIDAGFTQGGFLQIVNFGIGGAELTEVFRESEAFFALPITTKRRYAYRSAAENFGYQGLLEESLDPQTPPDLKETFTMRNIVHGTLPPERWPSPRFRDVMTAFYGHALACAHEVQRTMAMHLGLPADFFVRVHSGENVTLRLLRYPSCADAQPGAGAHTDYGFITLLFQRDVGGLQVLDDRGSWVDVPPRDDVVVVNSGDLLERWTNGRYRSTMHRVTPQTGGERFSIAMFVDTNSDTLVEPLAACVSADNPARSGPITAGTHLQAKLEASHKGRFAL